MRMLESCRVVLVDPMFGGNVGAVARVVKNTGLGEYHLVRPIYEDANEAKKFCHGAEEVLEAAQRHEQLVDAVVGCEHVVGFTVRDRRRRAMRPLRPFAQDWVNDALEKGPAPTALVFGNERDGLRNEDLDLCTDLVWIPSHPDHKAYNLAQAVLLAGYELLMARMADDPDMPRMRPRQTRPPRPSKLAGAHDIDLLNRHLRAAFLGIGYAYPHTVDNLVRSFHEIFSRAKLHEREVRMLRGLAHQVLWASQFLPPKEEPDDSVEGG